MQRINAINNKYLSTAVNAGLITSKAELEHEPDYVKPAPKRAPSWQSMEKKAAANTGYPYGSTQ